MAVIEIPEGLFLGEHEPPNLRIHRAENRHWPDPFLVEG
jgi:hypothetical protein